MKCTKCGRMEGKLIGIRDQILCLDCVHTSLFEEIVALSGLQSEPSQVPSTEEISKGVLDEIKKIFQYDTHRGDRTLQ